MATGKSVAGSSSLISLVVMGHASPLALDEELRMEGRCLARAAGRQTGHGHMSDGFLVEFARVEGTPDFALVVDQELIGQPDQLRKFRGDEDDGGAVGDELLQQVVDRALGPYVDTPGRLAEHVHPAAAGEHPAPPPLLLGTAGAGAGVEPLPGG